MTKQLQTKKGNRQLSTSRGSPHRHALDARIPEQPPPNNHRPRRPAADPPSIPTPKLADYTAGDGCSAYTKQTQPSADFETTLHA